ncbi:hypothetical protein KO500_03470 [Cellulophaga baltica]|uniref:hypothetical protein n=1 Tax=Cellulophaga TaxID=104264 RepID=UPI001C065A2E|nr:MULTISPECIES: hypothetical protein [Cellulophaga]MBU2995473.1 hypothetical protein [Cellulophaga baltica]MDO6766867.1 hypothetical protein [Cellulophaga sp. 1_MG-2023]
MTKILKYTEYLYLIVAVIAIYRVFVDWNINRQMAYLFMGFTVMSLAMYAFRRTYRRKFEKRQQNNKD